MTLSRTGCLLRIFIGENARRDGKPLYEWIVLRAREAGLAGATVLRGVMGFGANSRIHTTRILRLSQDLPVLIEIVDSAEKLESFLEGIEHAIDEGLATIEKVQILLYRGRGAGRPAVP